MTTLGRPTTRRTARTAAALLTASLCLGGCGEHSTSAARQPSPTTSASTRPASSTGGGVYSPTKADFSAVRRVLARRAHAVRSNDRHAFLSTVDHTNASLVAHESTLFANMSGLSIASLRYAMDGSAVLVPAKVHGHDPTIHPQITEFLRLGGSLSHPVTNPVDETFVKRDGRWVVGAEIDQGGTASFDRPQWRPWSGVPIVSRRVGDMTVLVDRANSARLGVLATQVHDAIGFDSHLLGVPPSYKIVVDATTNGQGTSFSSLSKEQAAAVTFSLVSGTRDSPDVGRRLAGLAIKINPHHAFELAQSAPLLRHELTHYLLHEYGHSNPQWLTEGIATWVQYYPDDFPGLRVDPTLYSRLMHANRVLPTQGLFDENPSVNYPVSQAAVAWLVSHYGMAKLLDLMRAYRASYRDVNVDALTPRMLHQVYGVTPSKVVAGAFGLLASFQH